jgi:hypothetical protein
MVAKQQGFPDGEGAISSDLIIFRLDDLKKGQDEFRKEVSEKFREVASRSALDSAIHERNQQFGSLDRRVSKIENSRRLRDVVTYVILGCSLVANLFMVYEIFTKGVLL